MPISDIYTECVLKSRSSYIASCSFTFCLKEHNVRILHYIKIFLVDSKRIISSCTLMVEQVEERSLRTHLIQLENERQSLFKA